MSLAGESLLKTSVYMVCLTRATIRLHAASIVLQHSPGTEAANHAVASASSRVRLLTREGAGSTAPLEYLAIGAGRVDRR